MERLPYPIDQEFKVATSMAIALVPPMWVNQQPRGPLGPLFL